MKTRKEIKQQAKKNFLSQYGISLGVFILHGIITWVLSQFLLGLGMIFVGMPLTVGLAKFDLDVYRGDTGEVETMFQVGFDGQTYWRNVGSMLVMGIFVFLWSLLLIVPGIIKALAYSMTPYILAESKSVDALDAITLSRKMTRGHKGKVFMMLLSFIGWLLLSILTFGLLNLFFTGPYMSKSLAGLYDELKASALAAGTITPEELA